jgi:hypothetical protein
MLVLAGMRKRYRQLTQQERDLIGMLLAAGHRISEIGRRLK